MALSAQTYVGDGVTTDFALTFTLGYISTSHIFVFVDEVEIPQNTLQFVNSGGTVRLPDAPANGADVLVRRIMPNDRLIHDYDNGALLIEKNLDESNLQAIYLQHESIDGFVSRGAGADLDMGGKRIINLADPVGPFDAVNYQSYLQFESQLTQATINGVDAIETAQQVAEDAIAEDVQEVADNTQYVEDLKTDFDSKYLGEVATLPDPTGLPEGLLAFLSGEGMRVIRNGEWANASAAVETIREDRIFSATEGNLVAGQTQFSIIHDVGFVDVYYNGTLLVEDQDYTSDGLIVTLTEAVTDETQDEIFIRAWGNVRTMDSTYTEQLDNAVLYTTNTYRDVNYFLNPMFEINQLGTLSLTDVGSPEYLVDMWQVQKGSGTGQVDCAHTNTGQIRFDISGSVQTILLGTYIELPRREVVLLDGSTMTFVVNMNTGSQSTDKIQCNVRWYNASTDTYESPATSATQDLLHGADNALTVTVPVITGAYDDKYFLHVRFTVSNDAGDIESPQIWFRHATAGRGTLPLPMRPKSYQEDLADCQRYLMVFENFAAGHGQRTKEPSTSNTNMDAASTSYPVAMWTEPTVHSDTTFPQSLSNCVHHSWVLSKESMAYRVQTTNNTQNVYRAFGGDLILDARVKA